MYLFLILGCLGSAFQSHSDELIAYIWPAIIVMAGFILFEITSATYQLYIDNLGLYCRVHLSAGRADLNKWEMEMSIRITSLVAAVVAVASSSSAFAQSQTFNPTSGNFTISDSWLTLAQSQTIDCNIDNLSGTINSSTQATINANGNSFASGDGLCTSVALIQNWMLTPVGGNSVRIDGIKVNSLLGRCEGTVFGSLDSTGYLSIPVQSISGYYWITPWISSPCSVEGGAQTNGPVTLVP